MSVEMGREIVGSILFSCIVCPEKLDIRIKLIRHHRINIRKAKCLPFMNYLNGKWPVLDLLAAMPNATLYGMYMPGNGIWLRHNLHIGMKHWMCHNMDLLPILKLSVILRFLN